MLEFLLLVESVVNNWMRRIGRWHGAGEVGSLEKRTRFLQWCFWNLLIFTSSQTKYLLGIEHSSYKDVLITVIQVKTFPQVSTLNSPRVPDWWGGCFVSQGTLCGADIRPPITITYSSWIWDAAGTLEGGEGVIHFPFLMEQLKTSFQKREFQHCLFAMGV